MTFEVCGAPDGYPVFLLHGTPGSRTGPRPRAGLIYRMGLRLISFDRPGYGGSDRYPGRSVAAAAEDVAAVADELDLPTFAVVGRSGGGPHALACAALLRHRVTSVAALVSLAPSDAGDLDWYEGMNQHNLDEYGTADSDLARLLSTVERSAPLTRRDPRGFLESLGSSVTARDRRVVDDVVFQRQLGRTYAEATRQGAGGWIDDMIAFRRPWGFDLGNVGCPVLLWHGSDDQFSPLEHTLWLKRHLPHADLRIAAGEGHFGAVEVLPSILSWVASQDRTAPSSPPPSPWPSPPSPPPAPSAHLAPRSGIALGGAAGGAPGWQSRAAAT